MSFFFVLLPLNAGASQKAPQETRVNKTDEGKLIIKKEKKSIKTLLVKKLLKKRISDNRIYNGFAIASLICGGMSILMMIGALIGSAFFAIFWPLAALAGIILGIVGLIQINRYYDEFVGKGLAVAGIALAIGSFLIPLLGILILLLLFF